jgi:large subunit ribosomal protein L30
MAGRLRVTQVKSTIGHIARNRATVRALGLRRIGDTVEVPDNDATRGMVRQVRFLVAVEPVEGAGRAQPERKAAAGGEPATAPRPPRAARTTKAATEAASAATEEEA